MGKSARHRGRPNPPTRPAPSTRHRHRPAERGDGDAARARTGSRPVCFDARRGHLDTPVYARAGLRPGDTVAGPAIVEEYGSTVPLHPRFHADVDRLGNLVVTPAGRRGPGNPEGVPR